MQKYNKNIDSSRNSRETYKKGEKENRKRTFPHTKVHW
jgi:hypothetical protein